MEMETKKKSPSKSKIIMYFLIIVFSLLYFTGQSGYYENRLAKSSKLTKAAIIEFEQDVKEGKAVDIKDYIDTNNIDYQNKYSKLGYTISKTIDTTLNDGVSYLVKILSALFS